MCYDNIWQPVNYTSETKTLSPSDDFEVVITKDIILSNLNGVTDLTLCDKDTENNLNVATYCYTSKECSGGLTGCLDYDNSIVYQQQQGPQQQSQLVISKAALKNYVFKGSIVNYKFLQNSTYISSATLTFQKVFHLADLAGLDEPPLLVYIGGQQVAFLYETKTLTDKKVSVILVKDLGVILGQTFQYDHFTDKLGSGQRLVLKNGNNYYLLYQEGPGFDMEKLHLKRLPDLKEYPIEVKVPGNIVYFKAGTNDFTIARVEKTIQITPTETGEIPSGVPDSYNLSEEYEVPITKNYPITLEAPKIPNVKKIYFCDEVSSSTKANICFDKESNKHEIYSLSYLNGASSTIYTNSGVAFLYEPATSNETVAKQVKVILIQDIASKDGVLEQDAFEKNMKNGRRLVLKLGNFYYLLSHPNVGEAGDYSGDKLVLQHLPSLENYSNSGYVTLVSKGVQGVQFVPYGETTITIYPEGNNYKISSKLSKEIATTTALPGDVNTDYEVSFNLKKPVALLDINGQQPTVSVCSNDSDIDPYKMLVCISNKPEITLTKNTPINETIAGKEFVLVYLLNVSKKYSFGFVNLLYTLSSEAQPLEYNQFMKNLAKFGRHLALKFAGKLYLIQHASPVDNFEMTNLSLAYYEAQSKIEVPAVGNEKKVTFSLPDGGRISVERDPYEETPPPFQIWAQNKSEIADIPFNLTEVLYVPFSSEGSLNIVEPNFGVISTATDDAKNDVNYFKLSSTNTTVGKFTLYPKTAWVKNGALFYYDNSYQSGDKVIKTVQIYKFYNLSNLDQTHPFTNEFIEIFTGGNELALFFNNTYYLLGYKGASGEEKKFDRSNMRLKSLNSSEEYSPSVTGL
ncbi:hypothetical protein HZC30_06290, partial [Candidatus Woesearchaeota archaeon]|nr:hypothetical protein [Candidatus Woesearchaeota archaeon]